MPLELRGLCPLLQVFDMPTSLAFYRDALGFEVVQAAPANPKSPDGHDWVWLRRGGAELMLNTRYDPDDVRPPAPDATRVEAHDDTALFVGCPDVDAAYVHLRDRGVAVAPPTVAPYGMKQLSVKDPDGFTVCFQWEVKPAGGANASADSSAVGGGDGARGDVAVRLASAVPQFTVADVVRTAEWYRDVLGFDIAGYWASPPMFAIVGRDDVYLHFNRSTGGEFRTGRAEGGFDAYVHMSGVDALAAELRARGAELLDGPEDRVYGMREVVVRDCNGFVLAFGEDTSRRGE